MKTRSLLLACLWISHASLWAGYAPYTERGTVDFDVFFKGLQPHGQWVSNSTYRYVFTPKAAADAGWRPYREGRWVYTDNGWTWRGAQAWDWATDHYGFWTKRGLANWSWVPGDQWLPAAVEWIQSGDYVGWRACELDRFSNMMESDEERYKDPSEWNFVLKTKMTEPLKASDFADDATATGLLKKWSPIDHVYMAWREIPRPGPTPKVVDEATQAKIPVPSLMNIRNLEDPVEPDSATQVFVFRPKFYQDMDGVFKRIEALLKGKTDPQKEKAAVAATLTPAKPADPQSKAAAEAAERKELRRLQAEQRHMEKLYK